MTTIICGVDVCAAWLDACVGGEFCRVENSLAGVEALAGFCHRLGASLVVMEATGGYERLAFGRLWADGLARAVVNPRAVRQFAEAMGLLEKTDRIDAAAIAWYAQAKRLVAQAPASDTQRRLAAVVTRLRQLTELRTMQSNQRRLVDDPDACGSIDQMLALIAGQIRGFEAIVIALIGGDPVWAKLDAAFRSIKGVADRTVARLLAELPEIGTLSNKAAAKLAGLAPLPRQRQPHRQTRGARRPQLDPLDPLRRRRNRPPPRTRLRRLPPAPDPGRQAKKSHPHRSGAQAPRQAQRQSPRRQKPNRMPRLTIQTVALPH